MDLFRYTVKDLLLDESFQRWVLHPDNGESIWDSWQHRHPEHFEILEDARAILLLLRDRMEEETEADAHEVWSKLTQSLEEEEDKALLRLTQSRTQFLTTNKTKTREL